VQGKTSVLFGAISIAVFIGIAALMVMMPQSSSLSDTDQLRQAVDQAARKHHQTLGLLAGPTITVGGTLPPTFEPGNNDNIAVLGAGELNTAIPNRLTEIRKEIQTAIDDFPAADGKAKGEAYSLMGQVHAAKAHYYRQSAENASAKANGVIAAIDSGILAIQKRLAIANKAAPMTKTQDSIAAKMKSDAETKFGQLQTAIATKEAEMADLKTKRAAQSAAATKHSNQASEYWTLSAAADRKERRGLQEKSFEESRLANKASLEAEELQTQFEAAVAAVTSMTIEKTSAKEATESADGVLEGFAKSRGKAKSALDAETLAMNATGKDIAEKAAALIAACDQMEAGLAGVATEYGSALLAMKQYRQYTSNSIDSVAGEAGILMGKALGARAVVSSRQSVASLGARLTAIWELASLDGEAPKSAEMTAFGEKIETDKSEAAKSFAEAATLYQEITDKAEKYKWSFMCRELQARRARHGLTGDAGDKDRATMLEQELEDMKGFPYVDAALSKSTAAE
jgi:hypothetical protein